MTTGILILLYLALTVGDVLTTNAVLRRGGTELNPVARFLMAGGKDGWYVSRFLLAMAVVVMAINSGHAQIALLLINILYAGVVGWNILQYRKTG